jgi:hypothetical protein
MPDIAPYRLTRGIATTLSREARGYLFGQVGVQLYAAGYRLAQGEQKDAVFVYLDRDKVWRSAQMHLSVLTCARLTTEDDSRAESFWVSIVKKAKGKRPKSIRHGVSDA